MHISEVTVPMVKKRFRVNRGGRPKSNRPRVDEGTPELQRRRAAALSHAIKGAQDPAYAEHPLGVLLMQGMLGTIFESAKPLYDAGISFASLWITANPKSFPTGTLGALQPGGSREPVEGAEDALAIACARLVREGRAVYDTVVNTCVYRRINLRNMEKLRTGLRVLTGRWQNNS